MNPKGDPETGERRQKACSPPSRRGVLRDVLIDVIFLFVFKVAPVVFVVVGFPLLGILYILSYFVHGLDPTLDRQTYNAVITGGFIVGMLATTYLYVQSLRNEPYVQRMIAAGISIGVTSIVICVAVLYGGCLRQTL
jgi:hypothetical protein